MDEEEMKAGEVEKPMKIEEESKPEEKPEGKDEDKQDEMKGKDMEMNSLVTALLGANMAKGDGAGKAGWGLGGFILGGLLNNNGNGGLFGGGTSNADRFATTDSLIQSTANQTQVQSLQSSYALSTQGFEQTASIKSELCNLSHQVAMGNAAAIQATKDSTCEILGAMKDQENANLREALMLCKIKESQAPEIVTLTQNVNVIANGLQALINQVASLSR